jgi:hypothetical protein
VRDDPRRLTYDQAEARRSALIASLLNFGCGVLAMCLFHLVPWPFIPFAIAGAVGLTFIAARPYASRRAFLVILQLDYVTGLFACIAGTQVQVRLGDLEEVFRAVQVSMIVISFLSPITILGVFWILAFASTAVVQFIVWPMEVVRYLPLEEPWLSIGIGAVAIALLVHRHRSARLTRELAATRAQRTTLEQLARMALAVRDLANTPLQTLTSGISLLRADTRSRQIVLDAMSTAVAKLGTLNEVLVTFEPYVPWSGDESFDAIERIERLSPRRRA